MEEDTAWPQEWEEEYELYLEEEKYEVWRKQQGQTSFFQTPKRWRKWSPELKRAALQRRGVKHVQGDMPAQMPYWDVVLTWQEEMAFQKGERPPRQKTGPKAVRSTESSTLLDPAGRPETTTPPCPAFIFQAAQPSVLPHSMGGTSRQRSKARQAEQTNQGNQGKGSHNRAPPTATNNPSGGRTPGWSPNQRIGTS